MSAGSLSQRQERSGKIDILSPIFSTRSFGWAPSLIECATTEKGHNYWRRQDLQDMFNVHPKKPRPRDDYFRRDYSYSLWKNVCPEEHKKALDKITE